MRVHGTFNMGVRMRMCVSVVVEDGMMMLKLPSCSFDTKISIILNTFIMSRSRSILYIIEERVELAEKILCEILELFLDCS